MLSNGKESSDWSGFLDRGSRVEGTLDVPGTFRLDGAVKGRIVSHGLLVLGRSAEVEGEIEAERIVIYGRFHGTLRAGVGVEVHAGAAVSGDVYTRCLLLEPGGRFDGHCYLSAAGESTDPLLVPVRPYSASGTSEDQVEPRSHVIRGRIE
jgi:cytoskeletal protein CcmA (bactofilin family)